MRDSIRALKARLRPLEQPWFRALEDGRLSRSAFLDSQLQFRFAVDAFVRPMQVLAARSTDPELRAELQANIADEYGSGDPQQAHSATFRALLRRLGADGAQLDCAAGPEVLAFNACLMGLALDAPPRQALAALGIIEDLFSGISAFLARTIVARGWLAEADIVHYAVHRELDVAHAEGFYRFLDLPWRKSSQERQSINTGLERGSYGFLQLYQGFLARIRHQFLLRPRLTGEFDLSLLEDTRVASALLEPEFSRPSGPSLRTC